MTGEQAVRVVRVYLTEGEHTLPAVLAALRQHVRGVTVFRGIAGFGASGAMHSAHWTDLSLDLPLVVEFFDTEIQVAAALAALRAIIEPDHVLTWRAETGAPAAT